MFQEEVPLFPTDYNEILQRIAKINPVKYGSTRNFIDGAVTYLSPYISRSVISTQQVLTAVLDRGYKPAQIEKFIQELAWRDYWQQVWIVKKDNINFDLKNPQTAVAHQEIPNAIVEGSTGVDAIDEAINSFYETGYLHNHVRMYIAGISCNMAKSHWKHPAQWMYYHLLDADWASNALSWQWVAGSNSNKKYVANQDNINKYCHTKQKGTFVDIDYSAFAGMEIPKVLSETTKEEFITPFPVKTEINVDESLSTCIYNFYNLDPLWKKDQSLNRILLLEPSVFEAYPISQKSVEFMMKLSGNIKGIQIFVGEFHELIEGYQLNEIYFKEHPLNTNYKGIEEARDWMFDVQGYFSSFFGFWKKCKKQINY